VRLENFGEGVDHSADIGVGHGREEGKGHRIAADEFRIRELTRLPAEAAVQREEVDGGI